ncbi:Hypothetical protein GLP15_4765 [Giardia lamblia P15]|uniref:Uncharacterized protein n=1 Tax=Giardia intestinalis (strain P15) TaxID=658858 RepID=E1F4I1_GIAIA|nr:Hypothetical protein GLP15_4765 [Giardia lamblia P15]
MSLADISNKRDKLISVLEAAREEVKKHKKSIASCDHESFDYTVTMKGLYDTKTVIVMALGENDNLIEDINMAISQEDNILSEPSTKGRLLFADLLALKESFLATNDLTDTSIIELKSLLARIRPELLNSALEMDKQVPHYLPTRSTPDISATNDRRSFLSNLDSSRDEGPQPASLTKDESMTHKTDTLPSSDLSAKDAYNKLVYSHIPVIDHYMTAPGSVECVETNDQTSAKRSDSIATQQESQAGAAITKDVATKLERRKARVTAALSAADSIRKNRPKHASVLHTDSEKTAPKVKINLSSSYNRRTNASVTTDDDTCVDVVARRAMYRQLMFPRSQSAQRPKRRQYTSLSLPPRSLESSLSFRQMCTPKLAAPKRPLSSICSTAQHPSHRDYTTEREAKGWPKASDKYDIAQIMHPPRNIYGHKKQMKTGTWQRYKYQEEACAPFRKLNPAYDNSLHGGLRYDKDPTLTYSVKNKPHYHPSWRGPEDMQQEVASKIHYEGLHNKEDYIHSNIEHNPFHNNPATSATRAGRKELTEDHYSNGSNRRKIIWDHSTKKYESRMEVAERKHTARRHHTYAAHTLQSTIEEPGLYSIKKTVYSLKNQLNDAKAEIRWLKSQVASQNNTVASFGNSITDVAKGIMRDNVRVASLVRANNDLVRRESNLLNAKITAVKLKAEKQHNTTRADSRSYREQDTAHYSTTNSEVESDDHHFVDLLAPYKTSDGTMSAQKPVVVLGHILDSQESVMLRRSADAIDALPAMSTALDSLHLSNSRSQPTSALQDSNKPLQRPKISPADDMLSIPSTRDTCKKGLKRTCDCSRCSRNMNKGFLQAMGDFANPPPMGSVPKTNADAIAFAQKMMTADMTNGYYQRRFVTAAVKNISDRPKYD